ESTASSGKSVMRWSNSAFLILGLLGCTNSSIDCDSVCADYTRLEEYVGALLLEEKDDEGDEIAKCLESHRRIGRTGHLCYLMEYGLKLHLRALMETKLSRELRIDRSPALAEL